jgi:hypothetical protein
MRDLIGPFSFLGGFLFCLWMMLKMKKKLLDVPKTSVTVQDIAEWVKRKQETDQLLATAREMRNKFLAEG